jgi:uncharacterized membrane protein
MSSASPQPRPERPRSRVMAAVRALVRARITAGVLTILPIMITFSLVWIVFDWFRDLFRWLIGVTLRGPWGPLLAARWDVTSEQWRAQGLAALPQFVQWGVWAFAIVLTFFLLYMIGLLAANVIGRRVLDWLDYLVSRVPFVKSVYSALKQIIGLFSGSQAAGFQRVALVPFPNEITRSVGFITNTMRDAVTGEDLCAVFIAPTPNPTTGYVFMLRRADLIEVDWTVEEAVKAIMSGGIISPQNITMMTGRGMAPPRAGLESKPPPNP